jgi:hypothetical protein
MQPFDRADLTHLCAQTRCRPASHLRLVGDTGANYDIDLPPAPYVFGHDTVRVIPGDDFFLAADEHDGLLVHLRYIDAPPPGTKNVVHVRFHQIALDRGRQVMILQIDSGYGRQLVYHADVHLSAWPAGSLKAASICPVHPAITASEMWSQAISAILLSRFHFDDAARKCQEY